MEIRGRYVESCIFSITWLDCRQIPKVQRLDERSQLSMEASIELARTSGESSITEVPLDDPELKRNMISCITNVHNALPKEDFLLNLLQGISSWYHALKLVAWILCYRGKLLEAV